MRFSKKTAHRIIIALAMVFPVAYMLGTQIATLAGAHGEELLANSYTEQYVEVSAPDLEGSYKFVFNETITLSSTSKSFVFTSNGNNFEEMRSFSSSQSLRYNNTSVYYDNAWIDNGYRSVYFNVQLGFSFPYISLGQLYRLERVFDHTEGSYSRSLFESIFAKGNFVERIGENSISENPKGFAPFASMLRYLDVNMLHAGDTQTGLMFYGMIYWMLHVILADLVYHMLVIIPNIIMAVCTWFGHGLDDDKGA